MTIPHRACASIAFLLLAAACSGGGTANSDSTLLSDSRCRSCRIVVDSIALLGHPDDTLAIEEGATPVSDSRGRFYLVEKGGRSVLVFGSDGRYLQSFGRGGTGPGEFRNIGEIHAIGGDTLLVIGGNTVHVISPEYEHVREFRAGFSIEASFFNTALADGRVVQMSGLHEFLLLDAEGNASEPVLLEGADTSSLCAECGVRAYREGNEHGTIWSGPQNRYRVEQHNLDGQLIRAFSREVNWFPEWGQPRGNDQLSRMIEQLTKPRLFGVRQTADGLLWTHVLLVDDPDKFRTINVDAFGPGEASDMLANFVTMVEAIDPETREVLASRELKMIAAPMKGELSAQMLLDSSGDWTCKIIRIRLEGR